jgi:hypothetical protein
MSDSSLMNPDHLKSEIHYLETENIPASKKLAEELNEDFERILDHIRDQYDDRSNDTIVLTRDQARDLVMTLGKAKFNTYRFYHTSEFMLKVYKSLLGDRRWFTAAKYLRFLKK